MASSRIHNIAVPKSLLHKFLLIRRNLFLIIQPFGGNIIPARNSNFCFIIQVPSKVPGLKAIRNFLSRYNMRLDVSVTPVKEFVPSPLDDDPDYSYWCWQKDSKKKTIHYIRDKDTSRLLTFNPDFKPHVWERLNPATGKLEVIK